MCLRIELSGAEAYGVTARTLSIGVYHTILVPDKGVAPLRLTAPALEAGVSANFTNRAWYSVGGSNSRLPG